LGKVIAIDGPSGAGKSTIARLISETLGFRYLDTGALYRAVALALIRMGITPEADDSLIASSLRGISVEFKDARVYLNGEDVSDSIRTPEIGHYSSVFSARRPVREFLLPVQRDASKHSDLVAEGRDMTTVVFPDAWKKLYIDASTEERARRRYLQLRQNGVPITMEQAQRDVIERDLRDSSRDLSPLTKAPDATYIDTSKMGIEDVIKKVLEVIRA